MVTEERRNPTTTARVLRLHLNMLGTLPCTDPKADLYLMTGVQKFIN